uniref:DDE Tnp4 domain-containing protein n=1 Tax=Hippocampus comes TaxID=109280 RepID=A0A3Q2XUA1_HIPCM
MSKEAFRYVCEKLRPSLSRVTTTMRKPVSVEKRVAITLWKLATNACYRTIGHLFGVAQNTVCVIVHQTCSAIVSEMSQDLIKWPVGDLMNENVRKFEERWGFPQVLGGIDGTHIPIIRPHDCHTDYYNRKGFYSVIMQAVVDSSCRFIDIFIGWPGSVHDARVFANSPLYQNRTSGSLFWGDKRDIGGVPVPLVLLGDAAYPLSTWLMKPFSDNGRLTQPQKDFNYKHSRARMVVENAFGRLKGRWRILLKTQDTHLENLNNIVAACCTLHNLCEKWGEYFDNEWMVASCENDKTTVETGDDQTPTCDSAVAIRQLPANQHFHSPLLLLLFF